MYFANLRKPLCMAVLGLAPALLLCKPASAALLGPAAAVASLEVIYACYNAGGPWCFLLEADPAGDSITQISLTIHYDITKFVVYDITKIVTGESSSGFLCAFSSNGACPAANPQLGTVAVPAGSAMGGDPRTGTSYSFTDDKLNGILTLQYDMSSNPATGTGNRNFFGIAFDSLVPFNGYATYFGVPGNYDFSITSFSCTGTQNGNPASCSGGIPVYGVNIGVPEPATGFIIGSAFLVLTLVRRRKGVKAA